jgi:hypothetical protein
MKLMPAFVFFALMIACEQSEESKTDSNKGGDKASSSTDGSSTTDGPSKTDVSSKDDDSIDDGETPSKINSTRPTLTKDKLEAFLGGIGAIGKEKCVPVIVNLVKKSQNVFAATSESINVGVSLKLDAFEVGDTVTVFSDPACQNSISDTVSDDATHGPYSITIAQGQDHAMFYLKGSNTRSGTSSAARLTLTSQDVSIQQSNEISIGSIADDFYGATTKYELGTPSPVFVENCHWMFVNGNNDSSVLYKTGVNVTVSLKSDSKHIGFYSDKTCLTPISQTMIAIGQNKSLVYFLVKKEHPAGQALKLNITSTGPNVTSLINIDPPEFEEKN